jgi:soluble lytic murein transglycosylase-like protein
MTKSIFLTVAFAAAVTAFAAIASDNNKLEVTPGASENIKPPLAYPIDEMVTAANENVTKARSEFGFTADLRLNRLQILKPTRPYSTVVARYAAEYGVPVSLAHAVITVESNYRPNVRGSAGEIGLMQIKPSTARYMGYTGSAKGLFDPEINIKFGMKYLAKAHRLGGGTTCGTILKYNAGHAAKRMNPVSKAYCGKVQRLLVRSDKAA